MTSPLLAFFLCSMESLLRIRLNGITLVSFLSMLNGITIQDSSNDSVRWDLMSKGIFTVKSYHTKLGY